MSNVIRHGIDMTEVGRAFEKLLHQHRPGDVVVKSAVEDVDFLHMADLARFPADFAEGVPQRVQTGCMLKALGEYLIDHPEAVADPDDAEDEPVEPTKSTE